MCSSDLGGGGGMGQSQPGATTMSSVSSVEVVSLVRPPAETMWYSRPSPVGPEPSRAPRGGGSANVKPELNDFGTFRSGPTNHELVAGL